MKTISALVVAVLVSACIFFVCDNIGQGPWYTWFDRWNDSILQGAVAAGPTFLLVAWPVFAWLRRSKRELSPASAFLLGAVSGIAVVAIIALISRGALSRTSLTAAALGGGAGFLTYCRFRPTPLAKSFWSGALVAWSGAYVWAVGSSLFNGSIRGAGSNAGQWLNFLAIELIGAGYITLVWSWFVLPLGGLLGVWMPRLVERSHLGISFIFGTILGALIGCAAVLIDVVPAALHTAGSGISGLQLELVQRCLVQTLLKNVVTMIPFAAVWVGLWTIRSSRRIAHESF